MPDQPIWQLSAGELSRAYRRRDLSPLEVTEALADRIAARNDDVGAFTTLTLERALADAAGLTEELAKGTRRGPLHGIPVGIKELFDVEDAVTTYGSPMLADRIAAADAARRTRDRRCQ